MASSSWLKLTNTGKHRYFYVTDITKSVCWLFCTTVQKKLHWIVLMKIKKSGRSLHLTVPPLTFLERFSEHLDLRHLLHLWLQTRWHWLSEKLHLLNINFIIANIMAYWHGLPKFIITLLPYKTDQRTKSIFSQPGNPKLVLIYGVSQIYEA